MRVSSIFFTYALGVYAYAYPYNSQLVLEPSPTCINSPEPKLHIKDMGEGCVYDSQILKLRGVRKEYVRMFNWHHEDLTWSDAGLGGGDGGLFKVFFF